MKTKKTMQVLATIAAGLMMIFSTALPFKAVADNPPVKQFHADEIYAYSQWGDSREIYSYDCGNLMTILEQELMGEDWEDSKFETYFYDADGLLLYKDIDYISWGGWLVRYTYTYDENGNKLTEVMAFEDGGEWFTLEKKTYAYDANGKLMTILTQMWNWVDDWDNMELRTYTYDSNGNCLTDLNQLWMGSWQNDARGLFSYENGVLISITSQQYMPSGWMTMIVTNFYYDDDGNYLNVINSASGNYWSKVEYAYAPRAYCRADIQLDKR